MDGTVQPIAMTTLGRQVTGLRIAASYACRNRDSLADAKLSEHARGNAIDISAFKLDGIGWIEVESGWNGGGAKAAFLRAVRGFGLRALHHGAGAGLRFLPRDPLPSRPRQAAHRRPQPRALLQIGGGLGSFPGKNGHSLFCQGSLIAGPGRPMVAPGDRGACRKAG